MKESLMTIERLTEEIETPNILNQNFNFNQYSNLTLTILTFQSASILSLIIMSVKTKSFQNNNK